MRRTTVCLACVAGTSYIVAYRPYRSKYADIDINRVRKQHDNMVSLLSTCEWPMTGEDFNTKFGAYRFIKLTRDDVDRADDIEDYKNITYGNGNLCGVDYDGAAPTRTDKRYSNGNTYREKIWMGSHVVIPTYTLKLGTTLITSVHDFGEQGGIRIIPDIHFSSGKYNVERKTHQRNVTVPDDTQVYYDERTGFVAASAVLGESEIIKIPSDEESTIIALHEPPEAIIEKDNNYSAYRQDLGYWMGWDDRCYDYDILHLTHQRILLYNLGLIDRLYLKKFFPNIFKL
jgi:hypothetical protein